MRIQNRTDLKQLRRLLRGNLTPAEARLWKYLQRSQLHKRKFRRQHSVGPYVLDFYCPRDRLAVELDGAAHDHEDAYRHDIERTRFIESLGITLLRFENKEVIANLDGVLAEILKHFSTTP